ncbi:hypothetical protein [Tateyamaria pelophila]|uniref:hypothetical protein n=1 Tax=Tateyamaria pelophila TaxID=328415 RepID=UPI001CBACB31|nr:hypothetical protein [Tateyamaria pelophila]
MTFSEFDEIIFDPASRALLYAIAIGTAIALLDNVRGLRQPLSAYFERTEDLSWQARFVAVFDSMFGTGFFSLRGFLLSSVISLASVSVVAFVLWKYLPERTFWANPDPDMIRFVAIGAAINVIPDYFSLRLTRFLVGQMTRTRSFWAHATIVVADLASSTFIIWSSIAVVRFIRGEPGMSVLEMAVLFSPYSAYFYSTFVTSLAALIFFLLIVSRRLVLSYLARWLTVMTRRFVTPKISRRDAPFRILGLSQIGISFSVLFIAFFAVSPGATGVARMDAALCDVFGERLCLYAARLSPDEMSKLTMLRRACDGTLSLQCLEDAESIIDGQSEESLSLMSLACDLEEPDGCVVAGQMAFATGDTDWAFALHERACSLGLSSACYAAGRPQMSEQIGKDEETAQTLSRFEMVCEDGVGAACFDLSLRLARVDGTQPEVVVARMQQACDLGFIGGCGELGLWYLSGRGVEQDQARGRALIIYACANGAAEGCSRLATTIMSSDAADPSGTEIAMLIAEGSCIGADEEGCRLYSGFIVRGTEKGAPDARKALSVILSRDPDNHAARKVLLELLILSGEISAAQEEIDKGLRRPGKSVYYWDLGKTLGILADDAGGAEN